MNKKILCAFVGSLLLMNAFAQPDRWQQKINYKIDAALDVITNKVTGTEQIEYYNNSPDTLSKVFFHMYWNAFQPNSSMDVRSQQLGKVVLGKDKQDKDVLDWDRRVMDRIGKLSPAERLSKSFINKSKW